MGISKTKGAITVSIFKFFDPTCAIADSATPAKEFPVEIHLKVIYYWNFVGRNR